MVLGGVLVGFYLLDKNLDISRERESSLRKCLSKTGLQIDVEGPHPSTVGSAMPGWVVPDGIRKQVE